MMRPVPSSCIPTSGDRLSCAFCKYPDCSHNTDATQASLFFKGGHNASIPPVNLSKEGHLLSSQPLLSPYVLTYYHIPRNPIRLIDQHANAGRDRHFSEGRGMLPLGSKTPGLAIPSPWISMHRSVRALVLEFSIEVWLAWNPKDPNQKPSTP